MWRSVIYKEWIKIRWFLLGYSLVGVLGVGYLFFSLKYDFTFLGATNIWNNFLYLGHQYFSPLKFLPVTGGLIIGLAQYFPETVNKRIKLAFHLPINENSILLIMHLFGTVCLLISFSIFVGMFTAVSLVYFPWQMVAKSLISIIPWFMAGFASYFFIALIVLEPVWKYRIFYTLVASFFMTIYLKSPATGAYGPANLGLLILTIFLSTALLFSANRFRRGEY